VEDHPLDPTDLIQPLLQENGQDGFDAVPPSNGFISSKTPVETDTGRGLTKHFAIAQYIAVRERFLSTAVFCPSFNRKSQSQAVDRCFWF
jgi:hypothetical protein